MEQQAAAEHLSMWWDATDLPMTWDGCVATIGTFDGVHRGHRVVLDRTVAEARDRNLPSVMVTFDPHPLAVVDPARRPRLLMPLEERARRVREIGIDAVYVVRFTSAVARTPADLFVADLLVDVLGARCVVVGEDFRFGAGNAGDLEHLERTGRVVGLDVVGVPLVTTAGVRCSSTLVRRYMDHGDLERASAILG